jgi:hypothetical protein
MAVFCGFVNLSSDGQLQAETGTDRQNAGRSADFPQSLFVGRSA